MHLADHSADVASRVYLLHSRLCLRVCVTSAASLGRVKVTSASAARRCCETLSADHHFLQPQPNQVTTGTNARSMPLNRQYQFGNMQTDGRGSLRADRDCETGKKTCEPWRHIVEMHASTHRGRTTTTIMKPPLKLPPNMAADSLRCKVPLYC